MWLLIALESLPWLVTRSICRAECRPGPKLLERSHCPVLWCLLCLETPLPGHSGTTRGQEGLSFGPQGTLSPVTGRNKVSASLLRCGVGVRYPELNLARPVPSSRRFPLPPAPRTVGSQRGLPVHKCLELPALCSGQTLGEAVPHLKSPGQWFALAEGKLEGCSGWEAAHARRGKKGSVHSLGVLRWRQLSLTVTSGEISS